jgi:hypothetical protein
MATDKKIVDLTNQTAPAEGDLVHSVDVSDTTDSATGTSKKTTLQVLSDFFESLILTATKIKAVLGITTLSGSNTGDNIADLWLNNGYNSLYRQALINGNFDVWQRGTSVAISDVTETYQTDRFCDYTDKNGGTLPTLIRSRQLHTPGDVPGSYYFSRLVTNGAGTSLGVSSGHQYFQKIEHGTSKLCGLNKKVTVSFYARSSIANKRICPTLWQHYGTGGSPSGFEIITGTSITLTSSWVKYTVAFTTNTLVGKTFGTNNDDFLMLNTWFMWGTTIGNTYVQASVTAETYGGSGTTDISQVQLCAGDVALPFMPKSFEEELRACQRYYEKSYEYSVAPATSTAVGCVGGGIGVTGAANIYTYIPYKVTKRSIATVVLYANDGTLDEFSTVPSATDSNATIATRSTSSNGFSTGNTGTPSDNVWFQFTASSEL